jgi:hypothetical protein
VIKRFVHSYRSGGEGRAGRGCRGGCEHKVAGRHFKRKESETGFLAAVEDDDLMAGCNWVAMTVPNLALLYSKTA